MLDCPFGVGYRAMNQFSQHLPWNAIEPVAEELFGVLGKSELAWAGQAWRHLASAGLASAANEVERHLASVRAMTLATVYRDFCRLAWKVRSDFSLADWWVYLDLQPLRLGQLLGVEADLDGARSEAELVDQGLRLLTTRERSPLWDALCAGFGNSSRLFIALWRTREDPATGLGPNGKAESDEEILNDLSFEKIDAFEFVSRGFPLPRPKTRRTLEVELDLAALGLSIT
jgi:hypothetical protein